MLFPCDALKDKTLNFEFILRSTRVIMHYIPGNLPAPLSLNSDSNLSFAQELLPVPHTDLRGRTPKLFFTDVLGGNIILCLFFDYILLCRVIRSGAGIFTFFHFLYPAIIMPE